MHKAEAVTMYANISRDLSGITVTDQSGRERTMEDARRAWDSGSLNDWNLSFQRLAGNHFDAEATLRYYREDRAKREGK